MGRESPPQSPQSPPQPELSPLLQKIGEHTRGEQKDDARFERIARGEATAEEIANLKSGKDVARDASDVDVAIRVEASRALGDDAIDRIVARVIPSAQSVSDTSPATNDAKKVAGAKAEAATATATAAAAAASAGAKVLRPTFGRRLITIGGPIAIAAALVLFISSQRGPRVPDGPELPLYSISASGDQQMRGGGEPVTGGAAGGGGGGAVTTRLHLGKGRESRFEIVLRPATAPIGKVVAYGFAVGDGPVPEPLEAKVEIAPEGAIRISGAARALEGVRSIRVVVGAPEAIGKFDDAIARAKGTSEGDAHVRVLTIAIDR